MTDDAPRRLAPGDETFMRAALDEARRAAWRTHPNPMVGALVVRDGEVLSSGYHLAAGLDHAEVAALRPLSMRAAGATLYVTLEPCNHVARTGPCTQAVIGAGVSRCVVGMIDPDPRVSGAGIATLRAAGLQVDVGVLEDECRALNGPFIKRVTRGLPFVTLKLAMTLDGRIATHSGHSRWITGEAARADVHRLRDRHDAVLIGTGTLLADDPELTTRLPEGDGRHPLRVVLDRTLRGSPRARVFREDAAHTLLVTSTERMAEASRALATGSHAVLGVTERDGKLDLGELLRALVGRGLTTVLCEGGGELAASLLEARLVDRLVLYIAPKVVGGRGAPGPVGGLGVESMGEALGLKLESVDRLGDDLRVVAVPDADGANSRSR